MNAIEIQKLTKRYGTLTAVDNLELDIHQGELFALLGINGAGKSTTIRMLCGLSRPDEGDARLLGHSIVSDTAAIKPIIGVSPQETAVAENLSVRENLELMCGIYGFSKVKTRAKISEVSERLNLGSILSKRAAKLSGGWKRRLSIGMAMISEPKILFLDEPTLGLDVIARSELWDLISTLKGKVTIVLTTHYMEEAEALSDRVGIMKNGKLLVTGTPKELMKMTSAERFEQAFISVVREEKI